LAPLIEMLSVVEPQHPAGREVAARLLEVPARLQQVEIRHSFRPHLRLCKMTKWFNRRVPGVFVVRPALSSDRHCQSRKLVVMTLGHSIFTDRYIFSYRQLPLRLADPIRRARRVSLLDLVLVADTGADV